MSSIPGMWEMMGGDSNHQIVAQLTGAMLPGKSSPQAHLLAMSRLPDDYLVDAAILFSNHVRLSDEPRDFPKDAINLHQLDEGARMASLILQGTIGSGGQGRTEHASVLTNALRWISRHMRRRGQGGMDSMESTEGI